jgi:hypothetical protein
MEERERCYSLILSPTRDYTSIFLTDLFLLQNCSITRSASDALVTVPSHYDTLPSNLWQSTAEAQV